MPKRRGTVHTEAGFPAMLDDPVFVAAGYGLPRKFKADYEREGLKVRVFIEIADKRAVAQSIVIETEDGISSTTLRRIPVRDIMATGCLNELWKVKPGDDGALAVWKPERSDADEVRQIVQSLVGYKPEPIS